ncbi:MAG: uroporphyrinogen decarboxylase [Planctomycetes bacterium RBG_16_59_8]|nr:MAG: uroporphyrinogen decarboxylase [Planctomycetes bacterium RBG_16_59_8]
MGDAQHLLLRALQRQPVERTPVWIMRQAGRYLPEYQAVRKKHDFLTMIRTPALAAEVTCQPVEILGVDAAILFSDILVVPEAMGMTLSYRDAEGPSFAAPVRDASAVGRLRRIDPSVSLAYALEAIALTKQRLGGRTPLIGFAGAPWTLAAFMVEGKSSHDAREARRMMYRDPGTLTRLLDETAENVILFLRAQAAAGADALQIFDTLAGLLAPEDYRRFGLPQIRHILASLRDIPVPKILFAKGQGSMVEELAAAGADCLSLDWQTDLGAARRAVGDRVALQGNLDPMTLFAPPERIRERVGAMLQGYGKGSGHVGNLGHGVLPDAPVDGVKAFVQAVRELSPSFHS